MAEVDQLVDIPFEVSALEHGLRVDLFLSRRIRRMTRGTAVQLIRAGKVRREPGGALFQKPSARVFEGERVVMKRRRLEEGPTEGIEIPVVYEDERLLAVSKPGDLVVHPTATAYHRTLIRILRTRRGDERLDLAHRIDKETSGLLLIAKDPQCSSKLADQFARRTVKKRYLAIVRGLPEAEAFSVEAPLRLVPDSLTSCLMEVGGEGAQPAQTDVEVLARGRGAALVQASPRTGRQHQIRVHLREAGHPILGDKLYIGGELLFMEAVNGRMSAEELVAALGHERQALHAWELNFTHPEDGRALSLRAPLPPDMAALAARVGLDTAALVGPEDQADPALA